jgi:NAD(P)-dependent dehydrogenase (short-subunit alcohol dehydrogenase family)
MFALLSDIPHTMAGISEVFDTEGLAVITGGAGGFGLEIGLRCAAAGMRVALLDVVAEKLQDAVETCGELAAPFVCDVTDPTSCAKAAADIEEQWPGVAISFLFNNAVRTLPRIARGC